jgi:hypothetical protein
MASREDQRFNSSKGYNNKRRVEKLLFLLMVAAVVILKENKNIAVNLRRIRNNYNSPVPRIFLHFYTKKFELLLWEADCFLRQNSAVRTLSRSRIQHLTFCRKYEQNHVENSSDLRTWLQYETCELNLKSTFSLLSTCTRLLLIINTSFPARLYRSD